jgi:hypothetical protein
MFTFFAERDLALDGLGLVFRLLVARLALLARISHLVLHARFVAEVAGGGKR